MCRIGLKASGNDLRIFAPCEDSDHPAHSLNLIIGRILDNQGCYYCFYADNEDLSDCADVQAEVNL